LLRALNRLEEFEANGAGSFLAYLRKILLNEVRAELRKRQHRGDKVDIDELPLADERASVVEHLVGQERLREFENEFGMSYPEIALETSASLDAVRMKVVRALKGIANRLANRQD
jgi:DNA-directed RNA polymerase specialized sigma24 family protein